MMPFVGLSCRSLLNRRGTVGLTIFAIAVSVMLVLGVERLRQDARSGFANTISGTDLVVGARGGAVQLLLYAVFRIGNATNNISWRSYRDIAGRPEIAWTIPLSLGDSHRGFRVVGTTADYFEHYRHGRGRALTFAAGAPFEDTFDVVLGAEVARFLGYALGEQIVVTHGLGAQGISKHDDKPFTVAGILHKTGTPVDRTLHVSLQGIEAMHMDWKSGARVPGMSVSADAARRMDLQPRAITAFLIGLKSRLAAFRLQREINDYRREPLLAALPGVALQELWDLMGTAEAGLSAISALVAAAGILGMLTMLLSGLNERRREIAVLRSVGARPVHIFGMLVLEAVLITLAGAVLGMILLYAGIAVARPAVEAQYGLFLSLGFPTAREFAMLGILVAAGAVAGSIPGYRAYRHSLADGMIVRT